MCAVLRQIAAAAAICAAALAAAPAWAQAVDLVSPVAPHEAAPDARPIFGSTREALASLDAAALTSGRPVRLKLFPGVEATFTPISQEPTYGGGVVWTGASGADDATLVLSNGSVLGVVHIDRKTFKIEPMRGRVHKIAQIAGDRLPPEGPLMPAPTGLTAAPTAAPEVEVEAGGMTIAKVLIAYTERAANASGDILSEFDLAIALANEAYKSGGVMLRLKLVGAVKVTNYDELTAGFSQVLYDVTDNTAPFRKTNRMRDELKADLVSVIQENAEYCGIAWYVPQPSQVTASRGFSTVSRRCIAYQTFVHELGHNMGLYHDRYVSPPAPDSQYNFGFVNVASRTRSIMAYNDKCADVGVFCERINYFSDPDTKVGDKPFGIPKGRTGAADSARRLNETRLGVASFR